MANIEVQCKEKKVKRQFQPQRGNWEKLYCVTERVFKLCKEQSKRSVCV